MPLKAPFTVTMRTCTTCPETDVTAFTKERRTHDGLSSQCRACRNVGKAKYRAARRQELCQKQYDYASTHRENIRQRDISYQTSNRKKIQARKRAYNQANREKIRMRYNAWYWANRTRCATRMKAYAQAHPDILRAISRRRRARKNGAPINDFTRAQWEAMKAHYGFRCVYCGKKPKRLEQDHLTPLSKRGSHTVTNIVPVCRSCNSIKGTRSPLLPVQPLLFIEGESA